MGQFSNEKSAQPRKDLPWTLDTGGNSVSEVTWGAIVEALGGLKPERGSYVVLEQKQGDEYWFL